uniref:Uncharacterized protein n=1 Tax=Ditylum brightwellii TaxID=49249 RepID=A0A7S4VWI7_9STRA
MIRNIRYAIRCIAQQQFLMYNIFADWETTSIRIFREFRALLYDTTKYLPFPRGYPETSWHLIGINTFFAARRQFRNLESKGGDLFVHGCDFAKLPLKSVTHWEGTQSMPKPKM